MLSQRLFLIFCLLFVHIASCATIQGNIELPLSVDGGLYTTTELNLVGVTSDISKKSLKRKTFPQENGYFEFKAVPEGSYILSISSILYNLQPFKTNVRVSSDGSVKAYLLQGANKLEDLSLEVPHPIRIIPNPKTPTREYLHKRSNSLLESGPVATILNNPLYLGGIIVAGLLLALPILLEKFDPETAQFMKEQKMEARNKHNKAALAAASKFQQQTNGALEKIGETVKAKSTGSQNIKPRKK